MLTNLFPPVATGSSIHSSKLAMNLVKRGVDVTVFTAHLDKTSPRHEVIEGVDVYRVPCIRLPKLPIAVNFPWLSLTMLPGNLAYMRGVLESRNCQLLHVHNHMFDMAFHGALLSRKLKLPMVLTIHSIIRHPVPLYNTVLKAADSTLLKFAVVRRANAVVDLDNSCTRYLASRFGRNDGELIPLAVDLPAKADPVDVEMIRDKYGLKDKKVLLSVGHLHHLRNRLSLIRGFKMVLEAMPECKMLIVGARNYQPTIELVRELGLESHVIFTGKQPHHLIPAFMEACDVHSMWFDLDPEGRNSLANANIEAMYYGKPVMGMLDINAYGEGVLRDWENIVITPFRDPEPHIASSLLKLFRDPELAQSIGNNAREMALETFNWDRVTEKHQELYRSVIG
ncbi:glycosyltransferase [Pseudodesulfovibrio sp. F-1]|uniref:Glycosyltransferase n=1 Tax=Pseudodesulfovibrio alkaliphilus TaxID=2661613 RepID=A0A7K1KM55_9BACT|nr:glycosyltransferase family 4 protein [Pseudodesulfovibrio alkaliphilus]MUM76962.1 glycosyltransferase [Pseudodesulfovibrio alkaliphilus]